MSYLSITLNKFIHQGKYLVYEYHVNVLKRNLHVFQFRVYEKVDFWFNPLYTMDLSIMFGTAS